MYSLPLHGFVILCVSQSHKIPPKYTEVCVCGPAKQWIVQEIWIPWITSSIVQLILIQEWLKQSVLVKLPWRMYFHSCLKLRDIREVLHHTLTSTTLHPVKQPHPRHAASPLLSFLSLLSAYSIVSPKCGRGPFLCYTHSEGEAWQPHNSTPAHEDTEELRLSSTNTHQRAGGERAEQKGEKCSSFWNLAYLQFFQLKVLIPV